MLGSIPKESVVAGLGVRVKALGPLLPSRLLARVTGDDARVSWCLYMTCDRTFLRTVVARKSSGWVATMNWSAGPCASGGRRCRPVRLFDGFGSLDAMFKDRGCPRCALL